MARRAAPVGRDSFSVANLELQSVLEEVGPATETEPSSKPIIVGHHQPDMICTMRSDGAGFTRRSRELELVTIRERPSGRSCY
jgi:hypothetical protein